MEQCTMPIYKVKTCHTCSWMVGMNCGVCAENLCYSQNYWQLLSALIGLLKSPIACLSACSLSFSRSSAWICTGVTGWWKTTSLLMIWSNASSQGRGNTRLVCLCSFITVNSSTMPLSVLSYGFPAADIILLIRSSLDPFCQKEIFAERHLHASWQGPKGLCIRCPSWSLVCWYWYTTSLLHWYVLFTDQCLHWWCPRCSAPDSKS